MNVFFLDEDPVIAAQSQCDKHVVKMVTETAQLLSTAHHIKQTSLAKEGKLYKACYINHPWARWVREHQHHYDWLIYHGLALGAEYTFRYGKVHKSSEVIRRMLDWSIKKGYTPNYLDDEPTAPMILRTTAYRPYCVRTEDQFYVYDGTRLQNSVVNAYRSYYRYKSTIMDMKWTKRLAPAWLTGPWLTRIYWTLAH